ncbi:MAG: S49 family peptidase [Methanolinea sp.]
MEGDGNRRERRFRKALLLAAVLVAGMVLGALACGVLLLSGTGGAGVPVIRIEGIIVAGEDHGGGYIGSEYVGRAIRDAADDPFVEAIVLRVNSPGGTPAAAQEIERDILYARQKKPVVVSMGDIATSAAYAVSAAADRIYANPDTLTGGIGTSWMFLDISGWLSERNISVEVVKAGASKDMGYGLRPLTGEEREYVARLVNGSNERLVSRILAARPVNRSQIEDARVLLGEEALAAGLVDELGNLNDAIEGARRLAGERRT